VQLGLYYLRLFPRPKKNGGRKELLFDNNPLAATVFGFFFFSFHFEFRPSHIVERVIIGISFNSFSNLSLLCFTSFTICSSFTELRLYSIYNLPFRVLLFFDIWERFVAANPFE
jgi:hypothetical protein